MYRQKHQQRMTLMAVAVLVPLAAACGSERAGAGSGTAGVDEPVTGIRWSVDSVTVDGTTHRAPGSAHVTLDDKGRAEGSYGCNTFSSKAAVDGDRISLSDAASTEMACDDQPMDFERALSRTLADSALKADVKGDRLTLTTDAGDTVRLSEAKDTPLAGTKWTVTTPATDSRAHLTFDEKKGTVSGSLGCNQVNAEATVRDGHITLGAPSTTRMMCEDSLMDSEKALTKLFDATLAYSIDHRTLTLTSENGAEVRAVAEG
ncbi:lipoprotein [Streptomyces griseoloalbus]|uniref:META domain-containing protein n=1 Tax=Streptomyces griseoloalbus TaxID=67303 RepID=UPI0018735400|nr:lipoprotein [Streptomyces griseoloalbus]